MKKILIVLMVLAMASVASATGIMITVNGEPYTGQEVQGSDWIQVYWIESEQSDALAFVGGFNINVDLGDYAGDYYVYKAPIMGAIQVTDPVGDGFDFGMPSNTMWGVSEPHLPEDDVVFMYEFHVPYGLDDSTYITIDTTGTYGGVDYSQSDIVLHVFPEPMTIALLGLGGLFLVRRRK
jgi:hypothetical protein